MSAAPVLARLESGLTVAVEPMPATRSVSIGVWVAVGSRDEPAPLAGITHFLEHLLFKGTVRRSAQDISRSVDRVGGDINGFTSKEYTAYHCRLPGRYLADGVELLGDLVSRPALRDEDVESERQVILEELAMDDDAPDDVAHRLFAHQLFGAHPLGRPTAGSRGSVRSITPDDLRRFHTDRYRAGNTVVAIAGAIDVDDAVEVVRRAFDTLPWGDGRVERMAPADPIGDLSVDDDSEQVHLLVGGRSMSRTDPDREALDVVDHVLGGGLSSRLFDEIRERRGLAYSIYSGAASYADSGVWSVYAGTLPEHAAEVAELVHAELERLVSGGVTDDELEIAVGYLTGSYELGLEDSGARMSRLGALLTTVGEVRPVEAQLARWQAVDHEAVRRVVERVYAAPPLTVALGPGYGR